MKIEQVIGALNEYFADTSRLKEDTLAGLQELQEELNILLDALQ